MKVNREYKDRLFKFIFGNPEHKEWTLSLYNAVNGSSYTDPEALQLTTIDDAVYMSMRNDVSFLIEEVMSFYEQQSTFNPNMPIRYLVYAGMVYSWYMENTASFHRYSPRLQHVPIPKCVCFYNGAADQPDRTILHLQNSFHGNTEPDIDVRVTMLNINHGHNRELMDSCKPLMEYSWFVSSIRKQQAAGQKLLEAVDEILAKMPEDFLIRPFLMAHQAEVKLMSITEYDEERTLAEAREDARQDGFEEGWEDGRRQGHRQGLEDGRRQGLEDGRRQGLEDGRRQGLEDGRRQGLEDGLLQSIRSLMDQMAWSAEQAMNALQIPADAQEDFKSKL